MQYKDICPRTGVEMRIVDESSTTKNNCIYMTIDLHYSYSLVDSRLFCLNEMKKWCWEDNQWVEFYTYYNSVMCKTIKDFKDILRKEKEDKFFDDLDKKWEEKKDVVAQNLKNILEEKSTMAKMPLDPVIELVNYRLLPQVPEVKESDLETFNEGPNQISFWTKVKNWFGFK